MNLLSSLHKTLICNMIGIAVLSVGLVGALWIFQEYSKFETESCHLKAEYVANQKALIKHEVDRVINYIEYQRSTIEKALKDQVKDQVYQAYAVVEIFTTNTRGAGAKRKSKA